MNNFGVSFSLKYAREMEIDSKSCLEASLKELGVRRLRLMSYWDIHEPVPEKYDFTELDWQFALASKYNAKVSLSIGLRQPRWPESHWPTWIDISSNDDRAWELHLYAYIQAVVIRYKGHACLESWQLENEALLKTFGLRGDFSRKRLKYEFRLVKRLDPNHPVIMTTSDSWGLPLLGPKPDIFGISIYRRFYDRGSYRHSKKSPRFYKTRASLIKIISNRPVCIHELQAEPWGPVATKDLKLNEQFKTMNPALLVETIAYAASTELLPAYVWGLEWWYYLKVTHHDHSLWQSAQIAFSPNSSAQSRVHKV